MGLSSKRQITLASLVPVALLILLPAVPAGANAVTSDQEVVDALTEYWTEYGVADEQQLELIAAFNEGIYPESLQGTSTPASEYSFVADGAETTVYEFADGSISTTSIEMPVESNPAARGISGCNVDTYTGVTYYTRCAVGGTNGVMTLGFYADITIQHYGYDIINDGYWATVGCVGTCTQPVRSTYVANETASQKARLSYTSDQVLSTGNRTFYTTLYVGGNSRTSTFG